MRLTGPIARISMCLALLGLSVLLSGNLFFGKYSSDQQIQMEVRRKTCESLAIQFSSLIAINDMSTIRNSLRTLVQRDDDIISAALRTTDDKLRAEFGNHDFHWGDIPPNKSTLTHTQVPIFKNNTRWGTVEIRFANTEKLSVWQTLFTPFVLLTIYVFIAGFVGYVFYMRRTLKHLDPSAVIPARVKAALDVLAEGVVLIDAQQQVVLANSAFGKRLDVDSADLLGKQLSSLDWLSPDAPDSEPSIHPWELTLADGESRVGTRMRLNLDGNECTLMVSGSAVLSDDGQIQGALVTFDDVTELEDKNMQLAMLVGQLEITRYELESKNEQLQAMTASTNEELIAMAAEEPLEID